MKALEQLFRYLSQAVQRIFSPNEKPIPEVGVQPFTGDPYDGKSDLEQIFSLNIRLNFSLSFYGYQHPWTGTLFL